MTDPTTADQSAPELDATFERMTLARRAASAESRNRPAWMPMVAGLGVFGALVYTLLGATSLRSAEISRDAELRQAQSLQSRVAARAQLVEQLESLEAGSGSTASGPGGGPVGIITRAAQLAGLEDVGVGTSRTTNVGGQSNLTKTIFPYNDVRSNDPTQLLSWASNVLQDSPSIEIDSIRLTNTEVNGWKMDIQFSRVEESR